MCFLPPGSPYVPAEGPELAPVLHHRVEHAEAKQQAAPLQRAAAAGKVRLREPVCVCVCLRVCVCNVWSCVFALQVACALWKQLLPLSSHNRQPPPVVLAQQVCLEPGRRLQAHLDAVLQDRGREGWRRRARKPQPEVLVNLGVCIWVCDGNMCAYCVLQPVLHPSEQNAIQFIATCLSARS